jgi:hypothetical protein
MVMTLHRSALILVLIAGCGRTEAEPATFETVEHSLRAVRTTLPLLEARSAFRRGDHRLLAINSCFGAAVLGISTADHDKYVAPGTLKYIAGTNGVIVDAECKKPMELAPSYAASYNQEMLWLIESREP